MNEEQQTLARQFAAAKKWVWLPGMQRVDLRHPGAWQRIITAERRTGSTYFTAVEVAPYPNGLSTPIVTSWLEMDGDCDHVPDLEDAVTRCALLKVVRQAWGDEMAFACPVDEDDDAARVVGATPGWQVFAGNAIAWGRTELDALRAALEAAPT